MRIGIDATCWLLRRGFGRHTRCLVDALLRVDTTNEYTLFTDSPVAAAEMPRGATVCTVPAQIATIDAAALGGRRRLGDLLRMSAAISTARLDVVVFPTVYSYVPVLCGAKKLVMIHDVTAETYPSYVLDGPTARRFWRAKVALGRWQADRLITVSEYSRTRIARHFALAPASIDVLGEGSDPAFRVLEQPQAAPLRARLGLASDDRAIVYVGGFSPHKNLGQLVKVFARLVADDRGDACRLLLVGDHDHERFHTCFESLRAQVRRAGLDDRVTFTGHLDDADLVTLLNVATVLVLPSLTEGFGLPAVEAAMCGCPVVATNASPLPDLLGDGGIFVDPHRPEALEGALTRVLASSDLRARMREAGLAAASRLSWTGAARRLVDLMHQVAA